MNHICHDCGKEILKGEKYMPYSVEGSVGQGVGQGVGQKTFVKCEDCYKADPVLRNFQEAEVYSRIVGYIRPVKNWNPGKSAEYDDRKVFSNPMSHVVSKNANIMYDDSPLS